MEGVKVLTHILWSYFPLLDWSLPCESVGTLLFSSASIWYSLGTNTAAAREIPGDGVEMWLILTMERVCVCGCYSGVCFVQLLRCLPKRLNRHTHTHTRVLSRVQFLWQCPLQGQLEDTPTAGCLTVHVNSQQRDTPSCSLHPLFKSKVKCCTYN